MEDVGNTNIQSRRRRYFELSSAIAQVDDARLYSLFDKGEDNPGWGRHHTIEVGTHKVFVKRIPLTELEFKNSFSTRNLYSMPTYYNCGVGSAGFGAFRELVANIKTTNWVLSGEIETFPLLFHYRICRRVIGDLSVDVEQHRRYVEYWGGSEAISHYMMDRTSASHELVLFIEHFPHVLRPWLRENSEQIVPMLDQLMSSIDFLQSKGVIHFDAHFDNVVTDGERPYLTDFGLVLDKSFDLLKEELSFFEGHSCYDRGEILACLGHLVSNIYEDLSEENKRSVDAICGIENELSDLQKLMRLLDNHRQLRVMGLMPISEECWECVARHRDIISLMRAFFGAMRANSKKDTPFPNAEIATLLQESESK